MASLKVLSLTSFFQIENVQGAVAEESRSEGKIGLKAYKNYFTAGAHWFTIILLILVNIVAQVLRDIGFVLCPQLDIYSSIHIYTVSVHTILLYFAVHLDLH